MLCREVFLILNYLVYSSVTSNFYRDSVNDKSLQLGNLIGRMNVLLNSHKNWASKECLMRKRFAAEGKPSLRAAYIFSVEGVDLRLSCDCLHGNQRWRKLDLAGDITAVDLQDRNMYEIDGKTLVLRNVQPEIATYFCETINHNNELIGGIWTVEVVPVNMFETKTRRNWRKSKPIISREFQLDSVSIIVGLRWNQFSDCSKCDTTGKRHRDGYCSVEAEFPDTDITPLHLYDSPISCSLFLELNPSFFTNFYVENDVITDLRHSLGQKHQLAIGYCKVNCSDHQQHILSKSISNLYKSTVMNGDEDNDENEDTATAKGFIWFLKSLKYGVPIGWDYLPEMVAFLSLICLQICICMGILKAWKSGEVK